MHRFAIFTKKLLHRIFEFEFAWLSRAAQNKLEVLRFAGLILSV